MVIRQLLTLALVLLWASATLAQTTLTVEPSRTELHETETLTLTVTGTLALSRNPGGVFDLNLAELPSPDLSGLEHHFKILSRNQQYSMRTVNGQSSGELVWTYHLAPLSSGELLIPPLTFKGATSSAHTISVKPGAPATGGAPGERQAFIELVADKDSVYVQEQLRLTVRLYFSGNLLQGELSEPSHASALIEPLGKQREFRRFRDGREYRVVERRYAVFPQQVGEFSLAPIEFQGQVRDPSGRLQFLRDSARFFDVPVKAPPGSFSGDTWLPARSLTLTESGIPDGLSLQQGDSLTRTLTLRAEGLTAEVLAVPETGGTAGLKSYPEQPRRVTDRDLDGLTGTLITESALVGVTAGTTTLPEIRIPWWDTTTDSEQLAILPAKTITIVAAPPTPTAAPQPTDGSGAGELPSGSTADNGVPAVSHRWLWLAAIMGAGWLVTLLLWARQVRRPAPVRTALMDDREPQLYAELTAAAKSGEARVFSLLPAWMGLRVAGATFTSVNDVLAWADDPQLRTAIQRLERRVFGAHQQPAAGPWDGQELVNGLQRLRAHQPAARAQSSGLLPPLYPPALTDRR
ncbi:BatD family protein [Marinobacter sp. X15-166B]|uniref:BatD family protein n=1 Tax=Marinobacter sp. X15-166B TaxID=1897620 RepID=UPI00085CA662|nr:BatD family protein [Marinobacter sp. X15-166B]OEY67102.1 hypothetical protein BG841_11980 [Marinobacter sp. X15-166B]